MQEDTTYVKTECHCGINTLLSGFDKSKIPFDHNLCHCNTCRHVSGALAFYYLPINGPPLISLSDPRPVDVNSKDINGYRSDPNTVRYFCANCAAHIFMCVDDTEWSVAGGCLERTEGITTLVAHINVEETLDGGLADQLVKVDGKKLPRYAHAEGSEEIPLGWRSTRLKRQDGARDNERLDAYCHCGAIKFFLTRPNEMSAQGYAPYPDMLLPTSHSRLAKIRNPKNEKWWLWPSMYETESGDLVSSGQLGKEPLHPAVPTACTKYVTGHCVCSQCRLKSGSEGLSWVFIPRTNLFEAGSPECMDFHQGLKPKGLRQYTWSTGKYKEFCGNCGASCFWWHSARPDMLGFFMGLIDQQIDGVRAGDWFKWDSERRDFFQHSRMSQGILRSLMADTVAPPQDFKEEKN